MEIKSWEYLDPIDSLAHYGVLGQKWGVRRYQNSDGTLTNSGRVRAIQKYRHHRPNKPFAYGEKIPKDLENALNESLDLYMASNPKASKAIKSSAKDLKKVTNKLGPLYDDPAVTDKYAKKIADKFKKRDPNWTIDHAKRDIGTLEELYAKDHGIDVRKYWDERIRATENFNNSIDSAFNSVLKANGKRQIAGTRDKRTYSDDNLRGFARKIAANKFVTKNDVLSDFIGEHMNDNERSGLPNKFDKKQIRSDAKLYKEALRDEKKNRK